MSKQYLINTNGFIGDTLFQTSIAKALKNREPDCYITLANVPYQLIDVLKIVPYIDSITSFPLSQRDDTEIINTQQYNNRSKLPTLFHQRHAGITDFKYQERDFKLDIDLSTEKKTDDKFRIGVPLDWEAKSFEYTLEEYKRGIDVPNLGYGGKHRNINEILTELVRLMPWDNVELVRLGLGYGHPIYVHHPDQMQFERSSFYKTAQEIADCDIVIGSEGGLTNLANALGVPTHTTTDFQMQLYGWNGVLEKTEMINTRTSMASPMGVKLGPFQFDKSGIHTWSIHYATDQEVVYDIFNRINGMIKDEK